MTNTIAVLGDISRCWTDTTVPCSVSLTEEP